MQKIMVNFAGFVSAVRLILIMIDWNDQLRVCTCPVICVGDDNGVAYVRNEL